MSLNGCDSDDLNYDGLHDDELGYNYLHDFCLQTDGNVVHCGVYGDGDD